MPDVDEEDSQVTLLQLKYVIMVATTVFNVLTGYVIKYL